MGHLGPSWGPSGAILGHLGAILGHLGPSWGPSLTSKTVIVYKRWCRNGNIGFQNGSRHKGYGHLGLLGPSWGLPGPSWSDLGTILGHHGGILGPSRGHLVTSWAILVPCWALLGPTWAHLGHNISLYMLYIWVLI